MKESKELLELRDHLAEPYAQFLEKIFDMLWGRTREGPMPSEDAVKRLFQRLDEKITKALTLATQNDQRDNPLLEEYPLPEASRRAKNLFRLMKSRRSIREYSGKPLTAREISALLSVYRDQVVGALNDGTLVFRKMTPSAGALYPIDLYLEVLKPARKPYLKKGVYLYVPRNHQILWIKKVDEGFPRLEDPQSVNLRSASLIIYAVLDLHRLSWKYGMRSLIYGLLEAGHLFQNFYLTAEALGLGACAIGGMRRKELSLYLSLEPFQELIYMMTFGKPVHKK